MYSTANTLAVTKSAIAQLIAAGYMDVADGEITALDDHYIVDLGEKLGLNGDGDFSVDSAPDVMFKSLLAQIGKIVVDTRTYVARLPKLFVDSFNFGIMQERIMIDISDCMIDEMWNPAGYINYNTPAVGGVYPGIEEGKRIASIEFGCFKPPISAKLYKKAHGLMVALTTAREQLYTAFRSLSEYESFLAGLYNSVENTLQVKAEIYAHMCVSMGIATAFANSNAVDLRASWVAAGGTDTGYTAAELIELPDFQRHALKVISMTKDYMRGFSTLYNDHEMSTFSSDTQMILLSQFAKSVKFGTKADTFNANEIGIGDYDTIPAWQAALSGSGDTAPYYGFDVASSIALTDAAATAAGITHTAGSAVTLENVIGVAYDRMAMGISLDRKKVTQQYAASRDTINSFYHNLINYVVNSHYPIVAFYISDYVAPTPDPGVS